MSYSFLSPDDFIKECMKHDKEKAISKISDYLQYDLAPQDLEWVAKSLSYAYLNELPEAEKIFNQIDVERKQFFAIEDDVEQYEELCIKEAEDDGFRANPRLYYSECF